MEKPHTHKHCVLYSMDSPSKKRPRSEEEDGEEGATTVDSGVTVAVTPLGSGRSSSSNSSSSSSMFQTNSGQSGDEFVLLGQGAEGKVYKTTFMSRNVIVKERVSKGYRLPELDKKLNKSRLLQESRCMAKCRKAAVPIPTLYVVDQEKSTLIMEEIEGDTLKAILRKHAATQYQGECLELARQTGATIGRMHDVDVGKCLHEFLNS
jgi:hypothetical protein